MEIILQALYDIAGVLPRVDKLKATFGDHADFQRILGLVYGDLAEFFRKVYRIFRRPAWLYWFAFDWGLFQHRFRSVLGKLEKHCEMLDREAAATHFAVMRDEREMRRLENEEFEKQRLGRMTQEAIMWLSQIELTDAQENRLHRLADDRALGTCDWILPLLEPWIEEDNTASILWLTGIPGAGKTMICSFLIDYLFAEQERTVLYFFCAQNVSESQECSRMLCTFATQCLRQHPDMAPLVHQAFAQRGMGRSNANLKSLLKELLPTLGSTRIILDGIDQYDDSTQKETLKILQDVLIEVQKQHQCSCKLLVSSRDLSKIDKLIPKRTRISLEDRPKEATDIYIHGLVDELKNEFDDFEDHVFENVTHKLTEKAKGMFLYVRLMADMLKGSCNQTDFVKSVEKLPTGLDGAYGLVLHRINDLPKPTRTWVFSVLFWLCVAYRSLDLWEVADGIVLRSDCRDLTRATRIQNPKRFILDNCRPIVYQSDGGHLELVHFTAKEYLLDLQSGKHGLRPNEAFIDVIEAHHALAFACIASINAALVLVPKYTGDKSEACLSKLVLDGAFGLQKYAQNYWLRHLLEYLKALSDKPNSLSPSLLQLLSDFRRVRRTSLSNASDPAFHKILSAPEFNQLSGQSSVLDILFDCLSFQGKPDIDIARHADLQAWEKWKVEHDPTFITLIGIRLREITESILSIDPSNLPFGMDKKVFDDFRNRYSFECRIPECGKVFDSAASRDNHQSTHMVTFSCLQCDYATRGFKSKRELDKHIERYHFSLDDVVIPVSMFSRSSAGSSSPSASQSLSSRRKRNEWNIEGQNVLQIAFQRAVTGLKNQAGAKTRTRTHDSRFEDVEEEEDFETAESELGHQVLQTRIQSIEARLNDRNHYQSQHDFREDIKRALNNTSKEDADRLQVTVDEELQKALSSFHIFTDPKLEMDLTQEAIARQHTTNPTLQLAGAQCDKHDVGGAATLKPSDHHPRPWSLPEKVAFPRLLKEFGEDFAAIANYLKTKSADEVKMHVSACVEANEDAVITVLKDLEVSRAQRQQDTAVTTSRLQNPIHSLEQPSTIAVSMPEVKVVGPEGTLGTSDNECSPAATPEATPHAALSREPAIHRENDTFDAEDNPVNQRPKTKLVKRSKKREEIRCPFCRKEQFIRGHDALRRHIKRLHEPKREAWFCKDVSENGLLGGKCEVCEEGRRYAEERDALKHLRTCHFPDPTMSDESLRRWWLKRIEEQNPRFDGNPPKGVSALQAQKQEKLPAPWELMHRTPTVEDHRIQRTTDLFEPVENAPAESRFLPLSNEMPANEIRVPSNALHLDPFENFHAQDVSFDDILPATPVSSFDGSTEGQGHIVAREWPYNVDKSLIRPDHVWRLPHLEPVRQMALHHELEALYQRLKNNGFSSVREVVLQQLRMKSQQAMAGLRAWRQERIGASISLRGYQSRVSTASHSTAISPSQGLSPGPSTPSR